MNDQMQEAPVEITDVQRPKGGCVRLALLLFLVVALLVGAAVYVGVNLLGDTLPRLLSLPAVQINPTPAVSVDPIATSLRSAIIGTRLQTNTTTLQHELRISIRNGIGNSAGYSATYMISGTTETGLDMTTFEGSEDTIRFDEDTRVWTIMLPAPVVLSCTYRVDSVTLERYSVFTPSQMGSEAQKIALYEASSQIRSELLSNDQNFAVARNQARRHYADLLTPIAAQANTTVDIQFGPLSSEPWSASCTPQLPACFEPSVEEAGAWQWKC